LKQVLQLPDYVNKEAITAKVCSGVLCVEVPKLEKGTQKHPAKMIEIQ
jgi:HSP20 family molecular chaperone IbpA